MIIGINDYEYNFAFQTKISIFQYLTACDSKSTYFRKWIIHQELNSILQLFKLLFSIKEFVVNKTLLVNVIDITGIHLLSITAMFLRKYERPFCSVCETMLF